MASQKRIAKELADLLQTPPSGIKVSLVDEANIHEWKVEMQGPPKTVFAGGKYQLSLSLPAQYPFSPPSLNFKTPVYHPNISPSAFVFPANSTPKDNPSPSTTTAQNSSSLLGSLSRATGGGRNSAARGHPHDVKSTTPAATPPAPSSSSSGTQPPPSSNICLPLLRPNLWKPATKISEVLIAARQILGEPNPDDVLEGNVGREWREDRKGWEKNALAWVTRYATG
ncbi:hypothetical protein MMC25_001073 [Agyrium rufum]|nr:hypothetical protein [Agyrium rufum]